MITTHATIPALSMTRCGPPRGMLHPFADDGRSQREMRAGSKSSASITTSISLPINHLRRTAHETAIPTATLQWVHAQEQYRTTRPGPKFEPEQPRRRHQLQAVRRERVAPSRNWCTGASRPAPLSSFRKNWTSCVNLAKRLSEKRRGCRRNTATGCERESMPGRHPTPGQVRFAIYGLAC